LRAPFAFTECEASSSRLVLPSSSSSLLLLSAFALTKPKPRAALPSPRATPRNLAPPTRLASPRNPPTPERGGDHGALPRRRRVRLRVGGAVARGGVAGVPALPGSGGAAHGGAVGRHARGRGGVRAAGLLRAGVLRRHLRPRHLPPQPPHRVPLPHGRPGARGARRRPGPPHPRLRRVQALHPPPPRVQVLVCHHKSLLCCFSDDILLCIRRSCLLANTSLLLGCAFCPDNEAANCAYDKVQVCPIQHRKAEIWWKERPGSQYV
uniref:Uncharacterized protein n=1 Tax=Oryza rufipogon TaxID=4529 RepID=A0A0E0Q2H1_ORYRU